MVVNYAVKGDSFTSDRPLLWTERRLATPAGQIHTFDVAPDGQRVAALMPAEETGTSLSANHVVFIENFFDELRRRVPLDK